jgi:FixJ family two-component response regulator
MDNMANWVAVVDDEESVRRAVLRLLRMNGLAARDFATGAAFLAALQGSRPACVILDLHMPDANGFDVQKRLAQEGAGIPVIVVTGQDSPETRRRAMQAQPIAYLLKPMHAELLLEAVRQALGLC